MRTQSLAATLSQRKLSGVFAVPGMDIRLQALKIAPEEKKHLSSSLPFTLEEQVTEDIGDLRNATPQDVFAAQFTLLPARHR